MNNDSHVAVIIPARFASSRLPGKPLIQLCGTEMVVRTHRRCTQVVAGDRVYVATDDNRIADVCHAAGIQVIMTPGTCLTGTDRVAEAAKALDAQIIINVQGDEPVFDPGDLRSLIDASSRYPGEVINGYCEITDERMFRSGNTPKVVLRPDGRLLYMSRAPIPTGKDHAFSGALRQVCAYAFPKETLAAFASRTGGRTPLEATEDIEILRFLEMGFEVRMIEMSDRSVAVDTESDIARAEASITLEGGSGA